MVSYGDAEFRTWAEENGFDDGDAAVIQKTARNRMLLWLALIAVTGSLGTFYFLPLFLMAWAQYKTVKRGSFNARPGFLFSLCSLAMYITFITIIPAIVWGVAKSKGFGSGLRGLIKKGLVGEPDSAERRAKYKEIKKAPRMAAVLVALCVAVLFVAVFGLMGVAEANSGNFGTMWDTQADFENGGGIGGMFSILGVA